MLTDEAKNIINNEYCTPLLKLLLEIEHSNNGKCPSCGEKRTGHTKDCALVDAVVEETMRIITSTVGEFLAGNKERTDELLKELKPLGSVS